MKISKVKIEKLLAAALCVIIAAASLSTPAVAQNDRDRGDRDRREKDDRDRRDRDRDIEREKWKQKFDLQSYLDKLDGDKSGVLESKELESERTRHFLAKLGINTNSPVRIDVAVKKAKAAYDNKRDAERKEFEDQVGPKLKGFGVQPETIGIAGFGAAEAKEPMVANFDAHLSGLKMTDFDEKTLKDARQMLDGYDRDKSGFLEGDEINRVRWKDPKPSESDLNSDGRISLLEMAQRLKDKSAARSAKYQEHDRKDRGDDRKDRGYDRGDRSRRSDYGRTSDSGRALTNATPTGRSSTGRSKSTDAANGDAAFTNYIDGVYKKYDTNGDNRLSQDELKAMRRPLKGDTNKDGFLSKKEATDYIKGDKGKDKDASKTEGANQEVRRRSGPGNEASRKYTPPKGPGSRSTSKSRGAANSRNSLGSMDKNSDGQIQMSEFSSTWDEETLQKFRKTDTDEDGIISAEEWAAQPK